MKTTFHCCVLALSLAGSSVMAQDGRSTAEATAAPVATAQDLKAMREALAEQQKEIQELRAEVERLSATQHPVPAAEGPVPAQTEAGSAKAEEKKLSELEDAVKRFRFAGDIRVRFEPIFQGLTPNRYRARLRARFGVEGGFSEDFAGGFYLATGTVNDDPVSTNTTLTGFSTRKPIGLDRGWVTFQPRHHKWLQLTGGKWAYTWLRTSLTLDPDLNPEGFSERLSFDREGPVVKNVSFVGMQLMLNEAAGSFSPPIPGNDSYAAGGQASVRLQLGRRLQTTLAGTVLDWRNTDSIIQAITARTLAGNRNTNATVGSGASIAYLSKFLYTDFIADTSLQTPWQRYPLRVTLDFVDNPRAANGQGQGFWGELSLGQTKNQNDLQFGYSFGRIEQDAVLAAFNESELRAPTNILQHRAFLLWQVEKNTTASFTGWFGRTLNRNLQNAALPPSLPPGEKDPYLKRLQFDVIYKF
jgi:hypothetical protein